MQVSTVNVHVVLIRETALVCYNYTTLYVVLSCGARLVCQQQSRHDRPQAASVLSFMLMCMCGLLALKCFVNVPCALKDLFRLQR